MPRFLVMAEGPDGPGIVATVSGVLASEGCNLEDTTMTRLGGRFVMLLMVNTSDGSADSIESARERLLSALNEQTREMSLRVAVHSIALAPGGDRMTSTQGEPWTVSVYGADHPGIVAAVSRLLANAGVNINDLSTRVVGDDDSPAYTMLMDVTIPEGVDSSTLTTDLERLGQQLAVSCHAHPVDADTL